MTGDGNESGNPLPPPQNTTTNNNNNNNNRGGIQCPNCGSFNIEHHDAGGETVCTDCGVVVEENAIVSAIEFVEGAGGSSSMVGQFVSASSSKAYTGGTGPGGQGIRGGRYGFSRDSRETTLANGRRRIQEVASRLRLGNHFVDAAHRYFTIAVEKNFVQGRRTTHVVAACLYISCRQEKSQHMLIDFADTLQVNVYTLGTCFLKFRRLLGLTLEIIDPALYIYRFAAHLGLEGKANAVSLTALRLVARMKRDWIVAGRRPAGICAAALLIAARAHGFDKDSQDVTKILRICGLTVRNRVQEFSHTPSAHLTLEQFGKVDLATEADPPIFRRNRFREARARAIKEGNVELLESGALDDEQDGKKAAMWRTKLGRLTDGKKKLVEVYETLTQEFQSGGGEDKPGDEEDATTAGASTSTDLVAVGETKEDDGESNSTGALVAVSETKTPTDWKKAYPIGNNGRALQLADEALPEEERPPTAPVEAKLNWMEWKADMPDDMVDDLDDIFRDEEEERQKEAIFNKINKDYLIKQERKLQDTQNAEKALANQTQEDAAQAESSARYSSKRSKGNAAGGPQNLEEQLLAAVSTRKVSRKINYDALSSIFDEDGQFDTMDNASTEDQDNGEPQDMF